MGLFVTDVQPEEVVNEEVAPVEEVVADVESVQDPIKNCPDCNGTGLISDSERCPNCEGTGIVA